MRKDEDAKDKDKKTPKWKRAIQVFICQFNLYYGVGLNQDNLPGVDSTIYQTVAPINQDAATISRKRSRPKEECLPRDSYTDRKFWMMAKSIN